MIIVRILGYALGIPAAIAGAILGFLIPFMAVAALLGYAPWSSVVEWVVIAIVVAVVGFVGQVLVNVASPDTDSAT